MASPLVREMLQAGIHFGHHRSRWNPKMKPYIYGQRNSIHILDIRETLRGLLYAQKFLSSVVASGSDVLFVGTKRQARDSVQEASARCGMHYVSERWLGGTLTNFRTIRLRLQRLEELEALVDSPRWNTGYSKKMQSTLSRELRKIRRNLDGVRKMSRLPGALVVVDARKEHNSVHEARSLGIPTVCLIDTDSDPDMASIPIPGNDDSMRSISLVMNKLADAIDEGLRARPEPKPETRQGDAPGSPPRRRGQRGASGPVAEAPPAEPDKPDQEQPVTASAESPSAESAPPSAEG